MINKYIYIRVHNIEIFSFFFFFDLSTQLYSVYFVTKNTQKNSPTHLNIVIKKKKIRVGKYKIVNCTNYLLKI